MLNRHLKRRMRALGLATAFMAFSIQTASAAITTDSVITSFQQAGYTRVEVRVGLTQMKVEAIKGNVKVETIYDIATGAVLKTETETVRAGENTAPGVSVRERNRDFVDAGSSNDDDSNDDNDDDDDDDNGGDDRDDDRDDDNDDNSGSDDSNDDDDDRDDDDNSGSDDDDDRGDNDNDDDDDHGGGHGSDHD